MRVDRINVLKVNSQGQKLKTKLKIKRVWHIFLL